MKKITLSYGFAIVFTILTAMAIIQLIWQGRMLTGLFLYFAIGSIFWIHLYLKRRWHIDSIDRVPQYWKFVSAWILIAHSKKVSDWVWTYSQLRWKF